MNRPDISVSAEKMAEIQHDIWSHWMKYQFSICEENKDDSLTIPKDSVEHWMRQMNLSYDELTEKERQSDRDVVNQFFQRSQDE